LEQNSPAAAEKAARDAAGTFHQASAWGREADAVIAIARAQLGGGNASGARTTLASADKYLAGSKDARMRLWRDSTQARILYALGRKDDAAAILERALTESRRLGFLGMSLEIQLAGLEAGKSAVPQLTVDAQKVGFLLIARKAGQ